MDTTPQDVASPHGGHCYTSFVGVRRFPGSRDEAPVYPPRETPEQAADAGAVVNNLK